MFAFACPVCGRPLEAREKSYICENAHSYDIARSGYINLLRSNQSGKRHGDDKLMVTARRDFLEKGYYSPLCERICEICVRCARPGWVILDAGCGDGWYTASAAKALSDAGIPADVAGVDISKDALKFAARRLPGAPMAVASVFDMPVGDAACDIVLNIFSPAADKEFARVTRPGGILLRVVPLERHLFGLKKAVYENPLLNDAAEITPEGFRDAGYEELSYTLHLDNGSDITALFAMTPYYYKTGERDQQKLAALDELTTEVQFGIHIYERI